MIIYNYDEIEEICNDVRTRSKIIFTNGCFDILHLGHLKILETAASFGYLIVGLNSDKSIERLKGRSRPINNEQFRSKILNLFEMVKHVVIFDELVPKYLVKAINPNIIIKGGDEYSSEELYKLVKLMSIPATIKLIPKIQGLSTTSMINNIKGVK